MGDNSNVRIDITASAAGMQPAVSQAEQNFNALEASANKLGNQLTHTSANFNKAGLSAGQLRMATQQLPLQFQDIWVSLAAGQSPMMVLIQQGTQISGSFGGVGNAAKAMGGYIMGLITPLTSTTSVLAANTAATLELATAEVQQTAIALASARANNALGTSHAAVAAAETSHTAALVRLEAVQTASAAKAGLMSRALGFLTSPLGMVTLAVGAGAAAWYYWGNSAEEAAKKAEAGIDSVKKKADEAANYTKKQQLQQLTYQIQSAEIDAQWQAGLAANTSKSNEIRAIAAKAAGEYRRLAEGLKRQKAELQKQISDEEKRSGNEDTRTSSEKAFADAYLESQRLLENTDPQAKANAAWDQLVYLKNTLGDQFPMTVEQMGQAYEKTMTGMANATEKNSKKMSATWETFRDSTQRMLGDQLFDGMMGKFSGFEDALKQMLFRISANMAAANLTEKLFGTNGQGGSASDGLIGGLMKAFGFADGGAFGVHAFANGGTFSNNLYTQPTPFKFANGGGFSLGVMGEAGPEAVMPLARDSSGKLGVRAQGGGGTTVVIQDHTTIHVDSRADRAQVLSDVSRLIDSRQGQLVERLRREKAIA
jgi:hypothetical protein